MFDYRLFYPESSIAEDRRTRVADARSARRVFQLPAPRDGRPTRRR